MVHPKPVNVSGLLGANHQNDQSLGLWPSEKFSGVTPFERLQPILSYFVSSHEKKITKINIITLQNAFFCDEAYKDAGTIASFIL